MKLRCDLNTSKCKPCYPEHKLVYLYGSYKGNITVWSAKIFSSHYYWTKVTLLTNITFLRGELCNIVAESLCFHIPFFFGLASIIYPLKKVQLGLNVVFGEKDIYDGILPDWLVYASR